MLLQPNGTGSAKFQENLKSNMDTELANAPDFNVHQVRVIPPVEPGPPTTTTTTTTTTTLFDHDLGLTKEDSLRLVSLGFQI